MKNKKWYLVLMVLFVVGIGIFADAKAGCSADLIFYEHATGILFKNDTSQNVTITASYLAKLNGVATAKICTSNVPAHGQKKEQISSIGGVNGKLRFLNVQIITVVPY